MLTNIKGHLNNVLTAPIKLISFDLTDVLPYTSAPVPNCWYCGFALLEEELQPILFKNLSSLRTAIPFTINITTYNNFPKPNIL